MVAGHLQQKKGYWYMVLNLYDEQGKRKSKWIATHLPVQGNKHRAEEVLLQTRQQYADSREGSGLLFADYMLQWLEKMKPKVSPTTYHGYKYNIERGICPYFRERGITLAKLRPADLERYYTHLQTQGLSANTVIHYHANIHKALRDAVRLDLVDRNVAVAFRVSPEENEQLEIAVRLSGLTKQDYITRRLLNRDIVVQGNPRVYKALRDQLAAVLGELRRMEAGGGVDDELLATIRLITVTLDGMKED